VTPRKRALAASSPSIVLLVGSLLWNLWDHRRDVARKITVWE